jgi:DNA-binding transcriptional ArsR family regulator
VPVVESTPAPSPLPADLLQDVAGMFGMLSATARLHIVYLLAHGERDVGTLAEELDQSVAAVSHHLAKLKLAGLVHARREGKRQVYVADDAQVVEIVQQAVERYTARYSARHTAGGTTTGAPDRRRSG